MAKQSLSGISILSDDLTRSHCRWIVSGGGADTFYCGNAVVEDKPYCAHHCSIAYNPNSKQITDRIDRGALSMRFKK